MDRSRARAPLLRAAIFAGIALVGIMIGYFMLRPSDTLPIFHPKQLDLRLVDPAVRNTEGEHHVQDFILTDQQGELVSLQDVGDRIIVADFFFTTCATICPKMSAQMERVQEAYKTDDRLILLSHSVTPEMDSVPALAAYAELHRADHNRWRFLTGDRKQIYRLARKSYFAAMDEGDGGPDDFVHTENFVLVDPQRRIRGFYDGTSATEVDRLIGDIENLLNEKTGK